MLLDWSNKELKGQYLGRRGIGRDGEQTDNKEEEKFNFEEETTREKERDTPGPRSQAAARHTGEAVQVRYLEGKNSKMFQGKTQMNRNTLTSKS